MGLVLGLWHDAKTLLSFCLELGLVLLGWRFTATWDRAWVWSGSLQHNAATLLHGTQVELFLFERGAISLPAGSRDTNACDVGACGRALEPFCVERWLNFCQTGAGHHWGWKRHRLEACGITL